MTPSSEPRLRFRDRAERIREEVCKLGGPAPAEALGDIGVNSADSILELRTIPEIALRLR